jgi:pimeloyl-ACP methyl ester carboxylesterase
MKKSIEYKGITVTYEDVGTGPCILLLHGYLETRGTWDGFRERLLDGFRVIVMDLPGHGDSGTWGEVHLMEDLAGSVNAILEAGDIGRVFLAGHSMGGYVTMAFADLYSEMLSGYCLFHSTCFADTEEKKKDRDREISLVRCNKKKQIINVNIPKEFADINLERFGSQVERAKRLAMENSNEGIVALLNGMKKRPDRTAVLKNNELPLLLIGGMMDNYIPAGVFDKLVKLAPHASVLRLQHSGHMGFVEEPEPAARAIREKVMTL